jgi:DNA polymerase-3 subunit alpha
MSFVHLHNHTHFSLLDGACKIHELILETKRLGMDSLAVTDHGNMYGVLEFYTEAIKHEIKPIIGCEVYLAPRERTKHAPVEGEPNSYHLVLLAKNKTGYKNLIKLTSYAFIQGFYYRPRIDKDLLKQFSEGLIVLSACLKGEVTSKLRQGRREAAIAAVEFYQQVFGDDFYLEVQNHGLAEEQTAYTAVQDLAREMGVPLVATNDVHYLHKKDHLAHDILLCLQTGKDRDDPNRMRYQTDELYLKSAEEMYARFKGQADILERTLEVAGKIDLRLDFGQRHLPAFPIPPSEGQTMKPDEYLEKIARRGLEKRYTNVSTEQVQRLEYELTVIKKMDFAGYFLIVQDFINAARERNIPVGLGRGSAAGSLVAYALGITNIDPLKYDLLFERFLNPERISLPDIDIDFCYERRDEVIDYVKEKYGKNNVAQIITFGTMASRGVIRDVSRVLKIPIPQADAIAKKIPVIQGKPLPLSEAFKIVPELKKLSEEDDPKIAELLEFSKTLEGMARHASVHAAGILIAPDDITNYVPLAITAEKEVTTQWTMNWCEAIGLLKMDFLGLRNLTVINKTEEMIRKRHDPDFSIEKIPMNDPPTFELFGKGNTVGVFQFESSGMQDYLRKLKPNRLEDLIAMNALYRPGPMDMIDDFIARKKGQKEITYLHPKLEPILSETYGIIVYQEQVMRITSTLGGFSLAESDLMRRIMGKKKKKEMEGQKEKFISGSVKNKIDVKIAREIAEMIEKFASYGFNKSHAAAYALIAYQTAFLKSNYAAEFMAANLSSEVHDTDRIVVLIDDCRRMGIEVIAPDINISEAHFEPKDKDKIAFGLVAIKNVGHAAIQSILEQRKKTAPFAGIFQLLQNVDLRLVNKKVLENLIQSGAMDSLEGTRAQKFHAIEKALELGQSLQSRKRKAGEQKSLFDVNPEVNDTLTYPALPDVPAWSVQDTLAREKEALGLYLSGHPLGKYKNILTLYRSKLDNKNGAAFNEEGNVRICGMITEIRTLLDKKQNKMAFIKLEDFDRTYEAVIFGSIYKNVENLVKKDALVLVQGRLNSSLDDPVIKIICDEVYDLEKVPALLTEYLIVRVDNTQITKQKIADLHKTLYAHRGKLPVYFKVTLNGTEEVNMISRKMQVQIDHKLLDELIGLIGFENLKVKVKTR